MSGLRGVPLFSPEARALCQRGPAWREHPAYYRDEPSEDEVAQQYEDWLMSLPEAHQEEESG